MSMPVGLPARGLRPLLREPPAVHRATQGVPGRHHRHSLLQLRPPAW